MSPVCFKVWSMAVLALSIIFLGDFLPTLHAAPSEFCSTFVESYEYTCAEYRIHTSDGFELAMHRIGSRAATLRLGSPASDASGADTAAFDCDSADQPFNSPDCSQLQPPSNEDPFESEPYVSPFEGRDLPESSNPTLVTSVLPSAAPAMAPSSPTTSSSTSGDGGFTSRRAPAFLMHPEFLSGDSWFQFTDPADRLLPFLLVNAGFDVWVGHGRATYWSHGHRSLSSHQTRYWDWTWDDRARYDVPAFLNYINSVTGFAVHYIGVSEGATTGAAAATMLQSSLLIRSLTLLGPTIYRGNTTSLVLDAWAFLFGDEVDEASYENGYQAGAFNFTTVFPITSINGHSVIAQAMGVISGPNCCLGTASATFTNGWDGTTSFKNLLHYQQGVRTNTWRHFSYRNENDNTEAYGVPYAPNYNPQNIPSYIPILVVYGGEDAYAPPAGIQHFLSQLPNAASVFLPEYAHFDLIYSSRRTQDVFIPILQFLEEHRWDGRNIAQLS